jgi:hypothetical protein
MNALFGQLETKAVPGVYQIGTSLRGSVSAVNTALRSLTYKPKMNWNSGIGSIGEIQTVALTVAPPKEIVSVRTSAKRGTLNGSFVLTIDQSKYGVSAHSIDTVAIPTNATAQTFKLLSLQQPMELFQFLDLVLTPKVGTHGSYTSRSFH